MFQRMASHLCIGCTTGNQWVSKNSNKVWRGRKVERVDSEWVRSVDEYDQYAIFKALTKILKWYLNSPNYPILNQDHREHLSFSFYYSKSHVFSLLLSLTSVYPFPSPHLLIPYSMGQHIFCLSSSFHPTSRIDSVKTEWTCDSHDNTTLSNQAVRWASDSVPRSHCVSIPLPQPTQNMLISTHLWSRTYVWLIEFSCTLPSLVSFCFSLYHFFSVKPFCVHTLIIVCKQYFHLLAQAGHGLVVAWQRSDSS